MFTLRQFQHRVKFSRHLKTDILANTSLYLRGNRTTKRAIVLPYFDLKAIIADVPKIEEYMKLRKSYVDLSPLSEAAPRYLILKKEIKRLSEEVESMRYKLNKTHDPTIFEETKQSERILRRVKEEFYKLDDICAPILLQIPNLPAERKDRIFNLCQTYIPPKIYSFDAKSHRELGGDKLQFMNQTLCYLLEDLAGVELSICDLFVDKLEESGRIPISGPDFVIDTIVEGACTENNIVVDNQDTGGHKMHLVGGSSLESFCAQFLRTDINSDLMQQYTSGRFYREGSEQGGLYSLSQSTRVTAFSGAHQELFDEVEQLLRILIQAYTELNLPFRLVYVKPEDLSFVEELRVDLEVFSPFEKLWKPMAHISCHGQFLSKRLTMAAHAKPMFTMFSVLADAQRIVAMLLENNQHEFGTYEIPEVVKSAW